jgi:hypothetical protein
MKRFKNRCMVTMAVTLEMMAAGMPARAETMLSNLAVTKGPLMCVFLSSLVLAMVLATATQASAEVIWSNPSTVGFSTLPLNTPTPFAFPDTGGMTMTRTSAVGSGVTPGTETITYAATISSFTNPAWVVGSRTYFKISYSSGSSSPYAGSTVSYESQFAGGLATTSQLVFVDFDAAEEVIVKAYDLANNLIPFASTSVLLSAGADSTPRFDDIEWASYGGATGRLRNIVEDDESNIVASINSTTSIARLVYEFDMNPDNDVSSPSIRFSFASVPAPSPVPEIDPAGMGSVLALVTGALGLLERRRLKAA